MLFPTVALGSWRAPSLALLCALLLSLLASPVSSVRHELPDEVVAS